MKKIFFSICALAAVVVGCNKSEMVNAPGRGVEIDFNAYFAKAPLTKAISADADYLKTFTSEATPAFHVNGFLHTEITGTGAPAAEGGAATIQDSDLTTISVSNAYMNKNVWWDVDDEDATKGTWDYPGVTYYNSDGGTGSYYNSVTNGTGLLDGKNFKYNPEDGYWHVWYNDTQTFGPILCASITTPCAYYEESLNNIESHGNKNLTVSNSTENYKQFIEVSYAAACNSDGVCYVTMELKEFLQKFSVSQRLFFDGNGFVESTGVYAIEEDQWLFACGYYEKK